MKTILLILTILYCNVVSAQTICDTTKNGEVIIVNPEFPPEFPGGEKALYDYLKKENQWVQKQIKIQGSVIIQFTVKKDGSLTDVKVIKGMEDFCSDCNNEALRLIRNMPKWKPGKFYDKPVDTKMLLPIKFGL